MIKNSPFWNHLWNRWDLVTISIIIHAAIFFLFVFSAQYSGKVDRRPSTGMFMSFIIALYAEMYGYPLTVYILGTILGTNFSINLYPPNILLRISGSVLIFLGFLGVYLGWREICQAKGQLVTRGIYRYVRHPQYIGLLLMTLGQMIQWPSILAIILWPGLVFLYVKLSLKEEQAMIQNFGNKYLEYANETGRFLPIRSWGGRRDNHVVPPDIRKEIS